MPDWADRYRRLAREAGNTSGRWRTSTVEIGRGPMLAVTEPGVHIITAMVATQLLKTAFLENVFGYHAHQDPCPMLLVQPKEDSAEQFSKERITPFVRATPALREIVGTSKTRNADETLLFKAFPGGFLAIAGAGSPDNLARRPVRIVLYDEVDKYPVTREGDPIALGDERMATASNWLSARVCSPTVEGESRIEASYLAGDQRRASMECPHCSHRMFPDFFEHVQWPQNDVGEHETKKAQIICEACGVAWSEADRRRALATIRWHQTRPFHCCGERQQPLALYSTGWRCEVPAAVDTVWDWWASDRWAVYRAKCRTCGNWAVDNEHASFQAGKLYSPWSKDSPAHQAKKWVDSKDDEDLRQAWYNTQAGLPYKLKGSVDVAVDALAARAETWAGDVPDGVVLLTAGIDTQPDRFEVEVVGWGRDEESWSIDYEVIEGDPDQPSTKARLDAYLLKKWRRADGREFVIEASCIDSGGHNTEAVYQFAKARLGRKVWAIKGDSERSGKRSPVWPTQKPVSKTRKKFRPIIIGTNAAKDTIRNRLALEQPGPGYMHFPAGRDLNYFHQLTAERVAIKIVAGRKIRVWEVIKGRANEAADCRVYAYAALSGLLHFGLKLNKRAELMGSAARTPPATADTEPSPPDDEPPTRKRRKEGFLAGRQQRPRGWLGKG